MLIRHLRHYGGGKYKRNFVIQPVFDDDRLTRMQIPEVGNLDDLGV
jgi:hypothetical protein